jgi:hypothetical protein
MPARLAFDVKKFAEEIDFFFRHAVREFGAASPCARRKSAPSRTSSSRSSSGPFPFPACSRIGTTTAGT